ncbi:hypothetical protein [Rhodococcus sp. X156]|uniref:SCO6745 family protein n=1 Tax=Rhodococcus sp. X156 TaxID=2499145 RepID=UPI000FDCC755|nr:hypothetical protein [Rhodococcus sp. X156]
MVETRRLGALTEVLHAAVYFAPEAESAYLDLGLRGFWPGYFASRAAALGPASAELVTAVFAGFAPDFVARAVPQIWRVVSPRDVLQARQDAAVGALRRLLGDDGVDVTRAASLTGSAVASLDLAGRPLAAAHAALPRPDDPLAALWHDCTVLREHRGDGHVAAVTAAGLRWPVPHLMAADRVPDRQQEFRGWSDAQWQAAEEEAADVDPAAAAVLEEHTDVLAARAYETIDTVALRRLLEPLAQLVVDGDGVPFPNAMGLRRPEL